MPRVAGEQLRVSRHVVERRFCLEQFGLPGHVRSPEELRGISWADLVPRRDSSRATSDFEFELPEE